MWSRAGSTRPCGRWGRPRRPRRACPPPACAGPEAACRRGRALQAATAHPCEATGLSRKTEGDYEEQASVSVSRHRPLLELLSTAAKLHHLSGQCASPPGSSSSYLGRSESVPNANVNGVYMSLRVSIHASLKLLSSVGRFKAAPSSSPGGAPAACARPPALRSKKRATSSTITPARAAVHDPLAPMKAFHPVYWYLTL